jgi:hypothetical protein
MNDDAEATEALYHTVQAIYVEGYFLAHSYEVTLHLAKLTRTTKKECRVFSFAWKHLDYTMDIVIILEGLAT